MRAVDDAVHQDALNPVPERQHHSEDHRHRQERIDTPEIVGQSRQVGAHHHELWAVGEVDDAQHPHITENPSTSTAYMLVHSPVGAGPYGWGLHTSRRRAHGGQHAETVRWP